MPIAPSSFVAQMTMTMLEYSSPGTLASPRDTYSVRSIPRSGTSIAMKRSREAKYHRMSPSGTESAAIARVRTIRTVLVDLGRPRHERHPPAALPQ